MFSDSQKGDVSKTTIFCKLLVANTLDVLSLGVFC